MMKALFSCMSCVGWKLHFFFFFVIIAFNATFSELHLLEHLFLSTASIKMQFGHLSTLHYMAALGYLHADDPWCILPGGTDVILGQLSSLWSLFCNGVQDCVSSDNANLYWCNLKPEFRELFLLPEEILSILKYQWFFILIGLLFGYLSSVFLFCLTQSLPDRKSVV